VRTSRREITRRDFLHGARIAVTGAALSAWAPLVYVTVLLRSWRTGRRERLQTSFATFEARLREPLGRMLGPQGFDGDAEILAITVKRWPHAYAYEPNTLWDPEWASPEERPWVVGRKRFGRIAIANSDAAAAWTDVAIDQAHRAVGELLGEAGA
jgi:spermidine dehydrogenase